MAKALVRSIPEVSPGSADRPGSADSQGSEGSSEPEGNLAPEGVLWAGTAAQERNRALAELRWEAERASAEAGIPRAEAPPLAVAVAEAPSL